MSNDIFGNTLGLKQAQLRQIEKLAKKRVPTDELASWELVKLLADTSHDIHRQIGVLINRKGNIEHVLIGDTKSLALPKKLETRETNSRLSGLRLLRTNLSHPGLSQQDFSDLQLKRLDLIATLDMDEKGFPSDVSIAHISPNPASGSRVKQLPPTLYSNLDFPFTTFIQSLEEELRRNTEVAKEVRRENRAVLCAISLPKAKFQEEDLVETKELARTAGLEIVDTIQQPREKPDPRFCIGQGKLEEVVLRATQLGASMLLFQQNLSPNQSRHLTDHTNFKVIDRTQLILDIFAQRATSHDGKLQVELAQLKYMFPRLREKEMQLSRLVGGIGGRGPGETKLEVHKRAARDRINRLEKQLAEIATQRAAKRGLRDRRNAPVISIVGYTNAGKSTLLNTLTGSTALAEDKLFATLDPLSRRLQFNRHHEAILTDTVGFIRNLPPDLITAFKATLEEIGQANVLIHVVDISNEAYSDHIETVNKVLADLGFGEIPQILVLNKVDRVDPSFAKRICNSLGAIGISATQAATCRPLLFQMESALWQRKAL